MSGNPWHKRYHSDALAGMLSLTLEERGAYQTVLDMIYDRGGPVLDNERLLAGYMGCSIRKWRSLRSSLVEKGKLTPLDGLLTNSRAEKEIENDAKTSRKRVENGSKGGRKKAENQKKHNKNSQGDLAELEQNSSLLPEARSQSTPLSKDKGTVSDSSKVFWEGAKGYLGNSKSSLIGKWSQAYGQGVVAEAITEAMLVSPQPADRVAYVGGILRKSKSSAEEIW